MWNPIRDIWIGLKMAWKDPLFHVVLAVMALFFLALASFSSSSRADEGTVEDRWGHVYPPLCQRDMSWVPVVVIYHLDLTKTFGHPFPGGKGRRLGLWEAPDDSGVSTIYVDSSITDPAIRAEVVRHELCHAVWWLNYGHPHWHAE